MSSEPSISRRSLLTMLSSAIAGTSLGSFMPTRASAQETPAKPKTNIADASKQPRNSNSMPGKFPGKVVIARNENAWSNDGPDIKVLDRMVEGTLLSLTGASNIGAAWREFVTPDDIIGLKVNPVAGKLLSTSPQIVHVIITQLEKSGIPLKNIVIWDRREFELHETGFTADAFPP